MQADQNKRNAMRKRKEAQRRKASQKRFALFILALFLVIAIPVGLAIKGQWDQVSVLQQKIDAVSQQKADLQKEISSLESELAAVNTDAFIEKYAREKLGMVKENEIVYSIEKAPQSNVGGDPEESTESESSDGESSEKKPEESGN